MEYSIVTPVSCDPAQPELSQHSVAIAGAGLEASSSAFIVQSRHRSELTQELGRAIFCSVPNRRSVSAKTFFRSAS